MKIKLIALPLNSNTLYTSFFLPYGLSIVAAFLRANNYNVVLDDIPVKVENNTKSSRFALSLSINLDILLHEREITDYICKGISNKKVEQIIEQIDRLSHFEGYDLVGFSIMSYYAFLFALLLSRKIKSTDKVKVVFGGPFLTVHGKKIFEEFPVPDYMIVGDGQVPLLRLIEYLNGSRSIENVPNLLYKQNGVIKSNPREFFPIEDLCVPDFSGLPLNAYKIKIIDHPRLILPYQITRGCAYNCSFCMHKALNPCFEPKSCDKVARELEYMKCVYKSRYFWFYDEGINCSYEYLNNLCDKIIEKRLDIYWRTMARADNLDRKILFKMKKAGCETLMFGIESGSNRVLKNLKKYITIEEIERVLKDSFEEGIKNTIFLMAGSPHEKEKDVVETIEFIKRNARHIYTILIANPMRLEYGTPLYNNPEMFGIENIRPVFDDSHRLEHKYFAFDETGGLKWEEKVRQQESYRKRIFKANFKYIVLKKYRIFFIPFWFYFYLREKPALLYRNGFFRLLAQLYPYFRRKI